MKHGTMSISELPSPSSFSTSLDLGYPIRGEDGSLTLPSSLAGKSGSRVLLVRLVVPAEILTVEREREKNGLINPDRLLVSFPTRCKNRASGTFGGSDVPS